MIGVDELGELVFRKISESGLTWSNYVLQEGTFTGLREDLLVSDSGIGIESLAILTPIGTLDKDSVKAIITKTDLNSVILEDDIWELTTSDEIGLAAEFTLSVNNFGNEYSGVFEKGNSINLYLGEAGGSYVKIMHGQITEVSYVEATDLLELRGWGWSHRMIGPKITRTYLKGTHIGSNIFDALQFLDPTLNMDYVVDTLSTLPEEIALVSSPIMEFIQLLLDEAGMYWKVDVNDYLILYPKTFTSYLLDGFKNYPVSYLGSWEEEGTPTYGTITQDIVQYPAISPSLKIDKDDVGDHLRVTHTVDLACDVDFYIRARVSDATAEAQILLNGTAGAMTACIIGDNNELTVLSLDGWESVCSITADTWYWIKYSVYWDTKTFDIMVYDDDGNLLGSKTAKSFPSSAHTAFNQIEIRSADIANTNTLWLDDLSLYIKSTVSLTVNPNIEEYKVIPESAEDVVNTVIVYGGFITIQDDFSADLSKWGTPEGTGTASVSNGYVEIDSANEYNLWSIEGDFDYTILSLFNIQDSGDKKAIFKFRANTSSNCYLLEISVDDNKCSLYKVVDDVETLLSEADLDLVVDKWYSIKIELRGPEIKIYSDVKNLISISDSTFYSGLTCLGVNNSTVRYDEYYSVSTRKAIGLATDSTLVERWGIKEIEVTAEEVKTWSEANSRAELELNLRKYERTSIEVVVQGTTDHNLSDIRVVNIPDSNIINQDSIITRLDQSFKDGEWVTELILSKSLPQLEEIVYRIREQTRRIAARDTKLYDILLPITDSLDVPSDVFTAITKSSGSYIWRGTDSKWRYFDWAGAT